jgi:glutaredoxin
MTRHTIQHLRRLGVNYEYIDIERDPMALQWVKKQNGGKETKPTLDIDGNVLAEPSDAELDELLAATGSR